MHLSVVIPVYNSATTLPILIERLRAVLDRAGREYEIVLVDDGSQDDSWRVLCDLQAANRRQIVAVQLMRNFGQHNALMCGFRHAQGEFVVTIDDDLQNPPEEIPRLLHAIESQNLDLVYGTFAAKQHDGWRNLGSWVVNRFFRLVFQTDVPVSNCRIIRRELLEAIFSYTLNYTYLDGLLAWNTRRVGAISVAHHPRDSGRSGYSVAKLLWLALNLFTNFSLLPLQVVSGLGLITAGAGLCVGSWYLVQFLLNQITVPGYASIIISILVLGGLQLLSLGVIGEYLGRLHLNVNRKPQYTVRTVRANTPAAFVHQAVPAPAETTQAVHGPAS